VHLDLDRPVALARLAAPAADVTSAGADATKKNVSGASSERDRWAQWLLERRYGGDPAALERQLGEIHHFRDRVLENAAIREGDVVLDVGTGTGLIGFGALDLVGETGRVIFSDVSKDLLDECRRIAKDLAVLSRCDFIVAPADDLQGIDDASVDVVTTRSVLIYLADKRPAFCEFFRVLRVNGRVSIFEPINSFGYPEPDHLYRGFDARPIRELVGKLRAVGVPPSEHPLLDFDERDLLTFAEEAGFREITLDYRAQVSSGPHWAADVEWETYKRMSGNPLDPTLEEAMNEALSEAEQVEFESYFLSLLERNVHINRREATAYLSAVKTRI
jgi:ubiquinone/menaquinone biosynthesis C-methylase UbiE